MKRIIDNLNETQRITLLSELLEDLKMEEREMIYTKLFPEVEGSQNMVNSMVDSFMMNSDENQRKMAKMIAEKRNTPNNGTSGVVGKKLV